MDDGFLQHSGAFLTMLRNCQFWMGAVGVGGHDVEKSRRHWIVTDLALGLPGCCHCSHGVTVVGAVSRDDLVAPFTSRNSRLQMILAGNFEGSLVCF